MSLLNELIIVFSLSILVFFIFSRFKIPSVVGLLITGVLVGPHGIGLIKSTHEVEGLAEIGIVLLLFTIGIEFSFKELMKMKRNVLLGGTLQVILTIFISTLILFMLGQPTNKAIFLGFLVSLSSTAIVLKVLQDRAEVDSPHGRMTLGILIFQDMAVVPMMLLVPLLAGATGNLNESIAVTLLKIIGIVLLVLVSSKWIVPKLLFYISKTQNRELFLLSIIVICFSVAWLTSNIGLSLALGAFLAGLIISESGFKHEALSNVLPFKDIFMSIFFISVGMLLNTSVFFEQPILIIVITFCVLILKGFIGILATVLLGFPIRTSILVGFKVLQVGEFAFILSQVGSGHGLLSDNTYQVFLAVSILTMVATPFLIAYSYRFADKVSRLPISHKLKLGYHSENFIKKNNKSNHVIIIGYGLNGKNLVQAAKAKNIDYTIIEMDPVIVREQRKEGLSIFHGDATHEIVLEFADIQHAKIIVIAISDLNATRNILKLARKLNPNIHIIIRTRYLHELYHLYELGANEVIPEQFETSIGIFSRVFEKYLIPIEEIESFAAEFRAKGYKKFRTLSEQTEISFELKHYFPDAQIRTFRIKEDSQILGKMLKDMDFRNEYGVTLLSVQRNSNQILIPGGDMEFFIDDVVTIIGEPENIKNIAKIFKG